MHAKISRMQSVIWMILKVRSVWLKYLSTRIFLPLVGASGLLNLGKNVFWSSKFGKHHFGMFLLIFDLGRGRQIKPRKIPEVHWLVFSDKHIKSHLKLAAFYNYVSSVWCQALLSSKFKEDIGCIRDWQLTRHAGYFLHAFCSLLTFFKINFSNKNAFGYTFSQTVWIQWAWPGSILFADAIDHGH